MLGEAGTPFEGGEFRLAVDIPERYPFEPPRVRFTTPVYHPNVDSTGRICHDSLKMKPKGAWSPSLNVAGVLASVRQLLREPNPDDALMADIAHEYRHSFEVYCARARESTHRHAVRTASSAATKDAGSSDAGGSSPAPLATATTPPSPTATTTTMTTATRDTEPPTSETAAPKRMRLALSTGPKT
jgi:ubiquitin-conjugating enzyme E2 T